MCCGGEGCLPVPGVKIEIKESCNSDCKKSCCCFPCFRSSKKSTPTEQSVQTAKKVEHIRKHHHKKHTHKSRT